MKPNGERVDYLIHQKVPYLAGQALTDVAMMLMANESLAEEFFESIMNESTETLEQKDLLGLQIDGQKCQKEKRKELFLLWKSTFPFL